MKLKIFFLVAVLTFFLILSNTPAPPVPDSQANSVTGYTTQNGAIFKNGTEIRLHGVNWFGFETQNYVLHGLWSRNYKDMMLHMKSLGFNAVRVPFCPTTLKGVSPTSINYYENQDLQGLNSLQVLDKVMSELNNNQLYILLDHHRPDCNAISELWYVSGYTEADWINDLKFVANRYKGLSYFMGLDLKNEPHGAAKWGTGNASVDWNTAAEKAGEAVLSVNSDILIFVEGIEENSNCSGNVNHWWGGNLEPVNCKPISTAKIPANKLVYAPHVYGPDVYNQWYFSDANFPNNMPSIWDTHFGFLKAKNQTVVIGEWGGKYNTGGGDPKDKVWQDAFSNYLATKKLCNHFYWSWNPNSGDTGGILKDDWYGVWTEKVSMLNALKNSCAVTTTEPQIAEGCKADYDKDGTVKLNEFAIFGQNYKISGINCSYDVVGNDCYLNITDFQAMAKIYKQLNACVPN